ncbi:MAG: sigma 54-interacting transcriptional regulator [Kofleriaceae bacterium]
MDAGVDLRPYRSLHAVVLVRELLRRWWGVELAFADPTGYVLDHADGKIIPSQNELCRAALFSKEGFRRCNESVRAVAGELKAARPAGPKAPIATVVHRCHLGFDVVAAPLWFGEALAGFLFVGGSMPHAPDAAERAALGAKVAEFAEVSPDALARDLDGIPRAGEGELERIRELLAYAAGEVVAHWRSREASPPPIEPIADDHPFKEIVGRAPAVRELVGLLRKVVKSQSTVLVHGESGTGKELIARAIHFHGPRAKGPFVVQNCSAFNDNLLESALFGHARGAFTGAVSNQKGLFEVADGGTFFLDEIGDMSAALQVKLLRVLQEGTFTPVGGTKPVKVDVRIIAASHKDLAQMVARKEFREDLFYRVNVREITVPPLRQRVADARCSAAHFLRKHQRPGGPARLTEAALDALVRYPWPGNIRELENEIERAVVLGGDRRRSRSSAVAAGGRGRGRRGATGAAAADRDLRQVMDTVEAEVILAGLIRTHWNKSQLAKELGISRSTSSRSACTTAWRRKGHERAAGPRRALPDLRAGR